MKLLCADNIQDADMELIAGIGETPRTIFRKTPESIDLGAHDVYVTSTPASHQSDPGSILYGVVTRFLRDRNVMYMPLEGWFSRGILVYAKIVFRRRSILAYTVIKLSHSVKPRRKIQFISFVSLKSATDEQQLLITRQQDCECGRIPHEKCARNCGRERESESTREKSCFRIDVFEENIIWGLQRPRTSFTGQAVTERHIKDLLLPGMRMENHNALSILLRTSRVLPELQRQRTVTVYACEFSHRSQGAAVAERLACSPPTKAIRVRHPAGSLPDPRVWESCRTMPLVGESSRGYPISPAPSLRRCFALTSTTFVGSQYLDVKSRPNLFTHSLVAPKPTHQRTWVFELDEGAEEEIYLVMENFLDSWLRRLVLISLVPAACGELLRGKLVLAHYCTAHSRCTQQEPVTTVQHSDHSQAEQQWDALHASCGLNLNYVLAVKCKLGLAQVQHTANASSSGIPRFPQHVPECARLSSLPVVATRQRSAAPGAQRASLQYSSALGSIQTCATPRDEKGVVGGEKNNSNRYTQCDENTARQFRALRIVAMAHLFREAVSTVSLMHLSTSNAEKNVPDCTIRLSRRASACRCYPKPGVRALTSGANIDALLTLIVQLYP
ncbi:hypothetical protein PR048_007151 [Dryococelus australis]|uniref:Uncharacterized protein n=1 Tax=Dryococelus australis TaxID=614101 RepID=A0ABQ9ICT4_9NEOP|nr:hypothetical protein PR048_007151 [Dryococelus australis]